MYLAKAHCRSVGSAGVRPSGGLGTRRSSEASKSLATTARLGPSTRRIAARTSAGDYSIPIYTIVKGRLVCAETALEVLIEKMESMRFPASSDKSGYDDSCRAKTCGRDRPRPV